MSIDLLDSKVSLLQADFADLEEMCAAVRTWDLDFRPLSMLAAQRNAGQISLASFGRVEVGHASLNVSIEQTGAPPAGKLTFAVPGRNGYRRLWWRGREVDHNMILVYPIGSEIHCFSGADFEIHTISIDDDVLAQLCQNLELIFPSNKQRPEIFPVTQERILFLQQRLEFLRFPARPMQEHALYEALSTLVKLWIPFRSTRPSTPDGTRGEAAVASCLERLNAPGWETLSLNDLTAHAAVSERTLQYAFRERFGATPSEFVKMRRLNSVRSALMRSDRAAVKVGDIAAENGFWHIGQFAADYKRAFGEVPSATVSRSAAP